MLRTLSVLLLSVPAVAQIRQPPMWPDSSRSAPASAIEGSGAFQVVDQLGHQDDFWQNALTGDADHDGRREIVLHVVPVGGGENRIVFYEDDGSGQFSEAFAFGLDDGGLLAMGDVDQDGLTDLFLERGIGSCDHEFFRRESSSPSGFPDHEVWTGVKQGNVVDFRGTIADVDADGERELVTADGDFGCFASTLKVFESRGTQNQMALTSNIVTGGNLGNPVVADLDLDGRREIAVTEFFTESLVVYESTGDDTLALASQTSHGLFNAYQVALITRPSPDGRPMLFLAGQAGSADYRVKVYEALADDVLTLMSVTQVPAACGASIAQIDAADLVGSRVPEIVLARLCDPVPVYQVAAGGLLVSFDIPLITESLEVLGVPKAPGLSGALVVGTFPTGSNPQGATLVLTVP